MSRWLVDHRTAWLDHLTAGGTFIANTIPVIGVVLVVSVGFLVARRWREPLFLISALVLEFVVFLTANLLIDRDRPNVPRLDSTPATASYPSGHIAATIVVWGGLAIIVMACTHRRAARFDRLPGGGGPRRSRRLRAGLSRHASPDRRDGRRVARRLCARRRAHRRAGDGVRERPPTGAPGRSTRLGALGLRRRERRIERVTVRGRDHRT